MYRKGEIVKYKADTKYIKAIVRTVHKTGGVTVEAQHHLNEKGEPSGAYLGFKYRMPCSDLRYYV